MESGGRDDRGSTTEGRSMPLSRKLRLTAAVALTLAVAGVAAPTGAASTPVAVDYGACAFGSGTTSVPAGTPITLTDTGGFATGTYGTALNLVMKTVATATIAVTGGQTTVEPLSLSQPAYFGAPFFAWLSFLPDISVDALAPNGSVLVTIDEAHLGGAEAVFPGQHGPNHFGPFHIGADDTFESSCLITAS
jgi:hypothetical protein